MRRLLLCALLVLVVGAAFLPAFSAQFVNWDDVDLIVTNERFRGFTGEHLRWMFTTNRAGPYQPLTWMSYAVDHALYGLSPGLDAPEARGFHATSVALHALTAIAFFFLARRVFAVVAPRAERIDFAALLAAVLFAIHPLRVESVAWVTERRDVLCGLFTVLALIAWMHWATVERPSLGRARAMCAWGSAAACIAAFLAAVERPSAADLQFAFDARWLAASLAAFIALVVSCGARWYVAAVIAFALASFSKASGMTFALVLIVVDVWPLRRWSAPLAFARFTEKLPFALLGFAFGTLAYVGQAAQPEALASWSEHTLSERIAQALYGLAFYPLKTLAPLGLVAIREVPDEIVWNRAPFVWAMLAVAATLVASWALRRKHPALLASFALFALLVAPMLGLAQCGPQLVADRYSYLPCMPFALLAAGTLVLWRPSRALDVAAIALPIALGLLTFRQTRVWHDSEALWTATLERAPDSAIANAGLADVRKGQAFAASDPKERGRLVERALELFERSLRTRPTAARLANVSVLRLELARLDESRSGAQRALAIAAARAALELATSRGAPTTDLHLTLGTALLESDRDAEALVELRAFVAERPQHYLGWASLGLALSHRGEFAEGARCLQRAVELRPAERGSWWFLGDALERSGDRSGAIAAFERVLALAPAHAGAIERLAALRAR